MAEVCFFITPIGRPGSAIRKRADSIQAHIIEPAIGRLCEVIRADQIAEPGSMNAQMFRLLIESPFGIADLHGLNPNVMYELGVRHAFNKPTVLLMDQGQKLLFDLYTERAVEIDISDLTSHKRVRSNVGKFIAHTVSGKDYRSPIISSVAMAAELRESSQHVLSELSESVTSLQSEIEDVSLELTVGTLSGLDDKMDEIDEKLVLLFKLVTEKIRPPKST